MPRPALLLLVLLLATVAAYWRVGECGFVAYDDPAYVRDNVMVNQGLRSAALCWAFTAPHASNWHPLTSLSHMLDCSLFDRNPAPMHWENLLWHLVNAGLVFVVWRRFGTEGTNAFAAAVVAGFFALHPLHVESVAWISARKDLLSTACWLLTLLAYLRWVARPSRGRYALVAAGCALALMAKPMAVTLPATLLLLDYWPLGRWPARSWRSLLREKIPLFALALAGGVATVLAQHSTGAADFGERLSLLDRLGNALVAYARYLGSTVWPETLAPFYPHPGAWPWWAVLGAAVLLAGLSTFAWRERARRPWLLFGWLWFLGTLLPVIGLLQVGAQSMADRYTYVPLLGLFTALAWSGAELVRRWPASRMPVGLAAALALTACAVRTAAQVKVWESPLSLVEHLRVTIGEHAFVHRLHGRALAFTGRPEGEVMARYRAGRAAAPENPFFANELALHAARQGRLDEARALLADVRALRPEHPLPIATLGNFLELENRPAEAERLYREALALAPRLSRLHRYLGMNLLKQGRKEEALAECREAVRRDRWDTVALHQLALAHASLDHYAESVASLERALWINPTDSAVADHLQQVRARLR